MIKRAVCSLCSRGFSPLVFFGRLRRHSAGGDGSAKIQMDSRADPFGTFDAGKAAKPAGQFRGGEQLLEAQQVTRQGTLLVFLEPLYKGGLEGVTPGSSCIANAYSSNHDVIASKDTGAVRGFLLHAVDALALVHALILRLQALVLPFQTLVFGGH